MQSSGITSTTNHHGQKIIVNPNARILSMTSGYGLESSNTISPSELQVSHAYAVRKAYKNRKSSSYNKDLIESQMMDNCEKENQPSRPKNEGRQRNSAQKSSSSQNKSQPPQDHDFQKAKRDRKNKQLSEKMEQMHEGIQLYHSSADGSSSTIPPLPLTSSQLADSYIIQDKTQKRKNEPFLYYQRFQNSLGETSIPWSHRPQELEISKPRKQIQNPAPDSEYARDPLQASCSNTALEYQKTSSKLNLAEYKTLISLREQALDEKILQVKDQLASGRKNQLLEFHSQRKSRSNSREPIPVNGKLRRRSKPKQTNLMPIRDESSPRHGSPDIPRSHTGQRYINYLHRNTRGSSLDEKQTVMHAKPMPAKKAQEFTRHKSVDNAKQYAISKITGKLNTKRELERVANSQIAARAAQQQLKVLYKEEAAKMWNAFPVKSVAHDESKSSFIKRFEKYQQREADRSLPRESAYLEYGSHFKEQHCNSQQNLYSNRAYGDREDTQRGEPSQDHYQRSIQPATIFSTMARMSEYHRMPVDPPNYYTFEAATEKQYSQQNKSNSLDQAFDGRQASPLLNSSTVQNDYNEKMGQASTLQNLMSRADLVLMRSSEQLANIPYPGFRIEESRRSYERNDTVQEDSQEYEQSDAGHVNQQYEQRIAELMRQCEVVQKLPEFHNERAAELKQRTMEIQSVAKNYTYTSEFSDFKQQNPNQNFSHLKEQETGFNHNQRATLNSDYYPKYNETKPHDASSSFVRQQQNIQSSFLCEEQMLIRQDASDQVVFSRRENPTDTQVFDQKNNSNYQQHLIAEDYFVHENDATRHQAIEREQIKNEQLVNEDFNRHGQIFSQQFTIGKRTQMDYAELEKSKKFIEQASSELTMHKGLRDQALSYQYAHTHQPLTTKQGDNGQVDPEKQARRDRRRQQREKKLQKLKNLHDLAQYSMSKIASGLTSQVSMHGNRNNLTSQGDFQSSFISQTTDQQALSSRRTIFEDKRESIKSQVEKLAITRKEIKKLIKIQNQHGKLLRKLQKSGVIKESQTDFGWQYTTPGSVSDTSQRQKDYQVAMSTNLLQQMQQIFKYLARIQQQLDFEINERQKRKGQVDNDKIIQLEEVNDQGSANTYDDQHESTGSQIYSRQQPLGLHQSQQENGYQALVSNGKNNVSHQTTSTLFWDTQMAYNNSIVFQGLTHQNGQQKSQLTHISQGSIVGAPMMQKDHQAPASEQKNDNKVDYVLFKEQQQQSMRTNTNPTTESDEHETNYEFGGGKIETTMNVSDQNLKQGAFDAAAQMTGQMSAQMSLSGIRVDQLCDILSREIQRVREESIQQSQDMRLQYEMELQAIRNEFNAQRDNRNIQVSPQLTQSYTQTADQKYHQMKQTSQTLSSVPSSETQTKRIQEQKETGRQQYQSRNNQQDQMSSTKSKQDIVLDQLNGPARTQTEMNQFSQSVFDELQRVKAERDLYYAKLLKVRKRIEMGRSQRVNANSRVGSRVTDMSGDFFVAQFDLKKDEDKTSQAKNPTKVPSENAQQYQTDFICFDDLRNVRSVNQISKAETPFERQWPSQEVQSHNINEMCTFQHDFSDPVLKQNPTTFQSLDSNLSSFKIIRATPLEHGSSTQTKQAGKMVHNFRSFEDKGSSSQTAKTRQVATREHEVCRSNKQYVNVRHNRTSMLRQNKQINEALANKCRTCLLDTNEAKSSQDRSFRSDRISNMSGTGKNGQMFTEVLSTLAKGERSSSREQTCQCKHQKPIGPHIYYKDFDSQALSNSSKNAALPNQRASTPQEALTFSAKGDNSVFSSQQLLIEKQSSRDPPSKSIGGGHQIQTMMARSPSLIQRMAAEHEQYFHNVTAHDSFENSQMQQTGGHVSENNTLDPQRTSQALSVINHYLEKYNKK